MAIFSFQKPSLSDEVHSIVKDSEGNFGIYIKNLSSGKTFTLNEHRVFDPASLYKLKLMVEVFEQIKAGKLDEDKILSADIKELNESFDIPEEDAELKTGEIDMSVGEALEQMITISHNYGALLLTKATGAQDLEEPITPKEVADFFEKIYQGKIIDHETSQEMLELLARQKINDRIPKYLPEGTKIAHKTGDLGYFENDAGIVFSPKGDFIIVVLSETKNPEEAGEKIARISEAAYKYFNK